METMKNTIFGKTYSNHCGFYLIKTGRFAIWTLDLLSIMNFQMVMKRFFKDCWGSVLYKDFSELF